MASLQSLRCSMKLQSSGKHALKITKRTSHQSEHQPSFKSSLKTKLGLSLEFMHPHLFMITQISPRYIWFSTRFTDLDTFTCGMAEPWPTSEVFSPCSVSQGSLGSIFLCCHCPPNTHTQEKLRHIVSEVDLLLQKVLRGLVQTSAL